MKDAAPGDAKQPEGQQWFIPFTQPTAAVFKLKHSKGKKANVRDEYKAFLLLEFGMVESGKYPGSKAELADTRIWRLGSLLAMRSGSNMHHRAWQIFFRSSKTPYKNPVLRLSIVRI